MKQKMIICISIFIVLVLTVIIVLNHPAFGRTPRGERLVRIERFPNYKKGAIRKSGTDSVYDHR